MMSRLKSPCPSDTTGLPSESFLIAALPAKEPREGVKEVGEQGWVQVYAAGNRHYLTRKLPWIEPAHRRALSGAFAKGLSQSPLRGAPRQRRREGRASGKGGIDRVVSVSASQRRFPILRHLPLARQPAAHLGGQPVGNAVGGRVPGLRPERRKSLEHFDLLLECRAVVPLIDAAGVTHQSVDHFRVAPDTSKGAREPLAGGVRTEPVSRLGDLWHLGEHRLLCGDCTDAAHVRTLMGGERAMLFATDPPYLVDYDGTNHPQHFGKDGKRNGRNKDWSATYGNTWDDADAQSDLYDRFIAVAVAEAVHDRAAWYCWHASKRHALLEEAWVKHGAFVHCQIIWAKNKPVLTRTWYLWQHEPCLMGWKKSMRPARTDGAERLSTIWALDTLPNTDERPDHPTPKPVELFARPMLQHTAEGDLCFEPFSGSGTCIVAAEQLRRRCYAIDIQPAYIDVAVRRWEILTGKQATLASSGQTFAAVAQERRRCRPSRSGPADSQGAQLSSSQATAKRTSGGRKAPKGPGARASVRRRAAGTAPSGEP